MLSACGQIWLQNPSLSCAWEAPRKPKRVKAIKAKEPIIFSQLFAPCRKGSYDSNSVLYELDPANGATYLYAFNHLKRYFASTCMQSYRLLPNIKICSSSFILFNHMLCEASRQSSDLTIKQDLMLNPVHRRVAEFHVMF